MTAAILSLFAGLTLGLLGAGGSILTVPILVYLLGLEPRSAVTASMVVVGLTSATGALLRLRDGNLHLRTGLLFGGAGMVGASVGASLSPLFPSPLLLGVFALVALAVAMGMFRRLPTPSPVERLPSPRSVLPSGMGVGALTGLIGTGGGFLVVPALMHFAGQSFPTAVGTSLVVITLNCAAGLASSQLAGAEIPWALALAMSATAAVGSLLGVRASRRLPQELLRRAFGLGVLILAVSILVKEGKTLARHESAWGLVALCLGVLAVIGSAWARHRKAAERAATTPTYP